MCSLLEWINKKYQIQITEPSKDSTDRQVQVSDIWNGLFWTILWCCIEHFGKKIWRNLVIIDVKLETRKSSRGKSSENSQLNRSDLFISYCFKLRECAQRVQAVCWSAIRLGPVYGSRETMFEKWISRISLVHKGSPAFKGARRQKGQMKTDKKFWKTSKLSASSNVKGARKIQRDHPLLIAGTQNNWNCPLFRIKCMNDPYAAVRKQLFCYGWKKYEIEESKVKACIIIGRFRKHNRLLISENWKD